MTGALGATALVLNDNSIELVAQASRALGSRTADDVASDEAYWRDIQSAFTLDRSLIPGAARYRAGRSRVGLVT